MISWQYYLAWRQYKSLCVLHLERTAPLDSRINVALLSITLRVMRALGGPQLAKLWEVSSSMHVPNHQDAQAYRQPIGSDYVPL